MTEKQIVWYILLTEVKIDSDTQYKVRGSHKALSDLWNTLQ